MFSLDLICKNEHVFEGCFKDYSSYKEQLDSGIIACPLCGNKEISRKYTGCSIQAKQKGISLTDKSEATFFELVHQLTTYIKENTTDVGTDFADLARAMHYGFEEKKNIRGDSTVDEINDLTDEGIDVFPLLDFSKLEN